MPQLQFLWDYSPGPPFAAGTTFGFNRVAAMSARPASSASIYTRVGVDVLYAGVTQPMFGQDFYDRFHISALAFDLGNLIGEQVRTITVWNAYRRARVLEALTLDNADGITLAGQPPAPLQFAPQQERAYQLTVSTDGPPIIEASITYDFDEGDALVVTITGSRVTPWLWEPNWSEGLLERIEWYTDILRAYRGEEQARALRLNPRQSIEFSVLVEGDARRFMSAVMWNWGARVWAVPLWFDAVDLTAPLASGVTTIPINPTYRDFRAGALAMLVGENVRDYEVVEIDSVGPSSVQLARATTRAWPAGTRVYPARTARIDGDASQSLFTGAAISGRIRFAMVEPAEYAASAGAATYRGYPVLESRPDWSEDPEITFSRKLDEFDPGVGTVAVEDEADMPATSQQFRWLLWDRPEYDRHRKLLFAMRGKLARIWVPTWTDDLRPIAAIGSTAVAIDIQWTGYTLFYKTDVNRRDIRIELADGTVLYRRITGSSEIGPDTERLLIDTALGIDLQPAQIAQISFLALCRQASDAAEFSWFSGEAAETATTLRSMRHDV